MTAAVRGRLVQALQLRIAEAEKQELEFATQDTIAAGVLESYWQRVAQVGREKLAEVIVARVQR